MAQLHSADVNNVNDRSGIETKEPPVGQPSGSNASSKQFLTSILLTLGSTSTENLLPVSATSDIENVSKLKRLQGEAAEQAKSALLTLHILYPHELLPALDLLDRKLVTKFICARSDASRPPLELFYVQSASAVTEHSRARSRYRRPDPATKTHYEVRLDSWNCSCAAFSQRGLRMMTRRKGFANKVEPEKASGIDIGSVLFGGSITKQNTILPTCKHILAAVIGTLATNLFGDGVKTRIVTRSELAAWAAGYGEPG